MFRFLTTFFIVFIAQTPAWALEAGGGWMRAIPPGQPTAAAYLTLRNGSETSVRLVAASAAFAGRVEIHESSQVDGMWRMRKLDSLVVPAEGSLTLAPGSVHLMLFGLTRPIRGGDSLVITLELGNGESLPVTIDVEPPGGSGPHHHH